jgi:hypothetical protein
MNQIETLQTFVKFVPFVANLQTFVKFVPFVAR